jgi:hypothetical protein
VGADYAPFTEHYEALKVAKDDFEALLKWPQAGCVRTGWSAQTQGVRVRNTAHSSRPSHSVIR